MEGLEWIECESYTSQGRLTMETLELVLVGCPEQWEISIVVLEDADAQL